MKKTKKTDNIYHDHTGNNTYRLLNTLYVKNSYTNPLPNAPTSNTRTTWIRI